MSEAEIRRLLASAAAGDARSLSVLRALAGKLDLLIASITKRADSEFTAPSGCVDRVKISVIDSAGAVRQTTDTSPERP